ncbi:hypothetical protein MSIBF_A2130001 [groundwater metagenome]|uniref:Transposase n=1 Tax=groundwater metagenome TaxID=717931 RepID=A0A098E6K0_9ZZZZ
MEIICKKCRSTCCIKKGKANNNQRYKCKSCGYLFVLGDKRRKITEEGKALVVLLYSAGKASYGVEMVDLTLRLCWNINEDNIFGIFQDKFLGLFS